MRFKEAARQALAAEACKPVQKQEHESKLKPMRSRSDGSKSSKQAKKADVRSVQRLTLPEGKDADWAASYYFGWLARAGKLLLRAAFTPERVCRIYLRFSRRPILELSYAPERSTPERALYYITGGLFAKAGPGRGRLEFLQIPGTSECIVAIHEYGPALPWLVYKYTQARIHLIVMYAFKKHLRHFFDKEAMRRDESGKPYAESGGI